MEGDVRKIVEDIVVKYRCAPAFLPHLASYLRGQEIVPFEIEIQPNSRCNLKCIWCIGMDGKDRLPNNLTPEKMDSVISGILDLGIPAVMFSGYSGEPMLSQDSILPAMKRLVDAGIRVGLFTNGTIPLKDGAMEILVSLDYVHISLDAGPETYSAVKEANPTDPNHSKNFVKALRFIEQLNRAGATVNIGYIIVPENIRDIHRTVGFVKDAGAKSIRFKIDISDRQRFENVETLDEAFDEIERAIERFQSERFKVHVIHSKEDVLAGAHRRWNKTLGCHFRHFFGTIGSDGHAYLCDHNTSATDISLGDATKTSLRDMQRTPSKGMSAASCRSDVCPPFGNEANLFIQELIDLTIEYGVEAIALEIGQCRPVS